MVPPRNQKQDSQPRRTYKLTQMQKKVLHNLTRGPRSLAQIYDNCCTYATANEQDHCHTTIGTLIRRELVTLEIGKPTLYHLTPNGLEAVQALVLEVTA